MTNMTTTDDRDGGTGVSPIMGTSPHRRFLQPREEREVQSCAAAAARRNRPTFLLLLAGAVLLVSVVFAGVSLASAAGARAELRRLAGNQAEIARLTQEIAALRAQSSAPGGADRFQHELQLSKLQAVNERVSLPQPPVFQEQPALRPLNSPIEKRRVDVTMSSVPLESALKWITEAQNAVPDLFISAIELRPQQGAEWLVRVQVARWELRS